MCFTKNLPNFVKYVRLYGGATLWGQRSSYFLKARHHKGIPSIHARGVELPADRTPTITTRERLMRFTRLHMGDLMCIRGVLRTHRILDVDFGQANMTDDVIIHGKTEQACPPTFSDQHPAFVTGLLISATTPTNWASLEKIWATSEEQVEPVHMHATRSSRHIHMWNATSHLQLISCKIEISYFRKVRRRWL